MKFNIVIIRPKGYLHSSAFDEIAQLLYYSFCDLGHSVTISENKIDTGAINIVFGGHLLPEGSINQFPDDSIFFNTEQVSGISLKTKKKIFYIEEI